MISMKKKMRPWLLRILAGLSGAAAFAAAPMIWQDSNYGQMLTKLGFSMYDGKAIRTLSLDPSALSGVTAQVGSLGIRNNAGSGEIWLKTGAAATAWQNVTAGGGAGTPTGPAGGVLGGNYPNPTLAFPVVIANSTTANIKSDSDTGIAFPSDGLINFYNNNIKTLELQPGLIESHVPFHAASIVLPDTPQNQFFSGPVSGADATPVFRLIAQGDIPSSAIPYPLLMPGSFLDIRSDSDTGFDFPSDGVIDIWANNVKTAEFISGQISLLAGVTITGDLNVGGNIGFSDKPANTVFAGPNSGADAAPSFRTLISDDIPVIDISSSGSPKVTGFLPITNGGTGLGGYSYGSVPFMKLDNTLGEDNQGLSYNETSRRLQMRDFYINGDHTDEGGNFSIGAMNGTLTSTTAAVNSDVYLVQRNLYGNFLTIQGPAYNDNLIGVTTNLVIGRLVSIGLSSATHVVLFKGDDVEINPSDDSVIDDFEARTTTPTLRGTMGNIVLDKVNPNTNGLHEVTGNVFARQTFLQGITASRVVGHQMDISNTNMNTTPYTRPLSFSYSGPSFAINAFSTPFDSTPPSLVDTVSSINMGFSVVPGSPVMTYGDVVGLSETMSLSVSTTIPVGAAGIGISSHGYIPLVGIEPGLTVPEFGGGVMALVDTFGQQGQTGGTLDTAFMLKFRGIFPGGGSNVFTNAKPFWFPNGSCAGFANCFSLASEDPTARVYSAGPLQLGLTPDTVPYLDGTTTVVSSAVTSTELGYLTGITANVQDQINAGGGGGGGNFVSKDGDSMSGILHIGSNLYVDQFVGLGTSNPLSQLQVHVGTNQNLLVQVTQNAGSGPALSSITDANDNNLGLEFRGRPVLLSAPGSGSYIGFAPNSVTQVQMNDGGMVLNNSYTLQLSGSVNNNRALVTDGSNIVTSSTTTATEIGFLGGVTGNIQSQFDARPETAAGFVNTACSLTAGTPNADHATGVAPSSGCTVVFTHSAPNDWACTITPDASGFSPFISAHTSSDFTFRTGVLDAGVSFNCTAL